MNTTQCLIFSPSDDDYRYPGIKDTLLPGDTLLLVLNLVNITFTCTICVAVSELMCVVCQRLAHLVKGWNHNFKW